MEVHQQEFFLPNKGLEHMGNMWVYEWRFCYIFSDLEEFELSETEQ